MNERIKELANKAGYNDQIYEISKEGLDKFAELIVEECVEFVFKKVGAKSALDLSKHFGVEK
jgi:hypothetical protein